MNPLRYVLIALSAGGALWSIFALKIYARQLEWFPLLFLLFVGLACVANFVYLLDSNSKPNSRLGRMFRLWFNAKERELEQRVTAAGSPHSEASGASQHKS